MAGLLDLHVVATLQAGWAYYEASLSEFQALFPTGVSASVLEEWHTALVARVRTKTFHILGNPGVEGGPNEKWPDVAVELLDESLAPERFMEDGRRLDPLTGRQSIALQVIQRVRVDVFAYSPETARALQRVVFAILTTSLPAFLSAGYASLDYEGSEELSFEEQTIAESMGAFVFRLRYSARAVLTLPTPDPAQTSKAWWVRMADLDLDGRPGGVVPFDS